MAPRPLRFRQLEPVVGLELPYALASMRVRHYVLRRRFVRDPRRLMSRIILAAQALGLDWEEHVTHAQDQVILDLLPPDFPWLFRRFERRLLDLNRRHFGLALDHWQTMRLNLYRAGARVGHDAHSDYATPEPAKLAFTIVLLAPARGGETTISQVGAIPLAPGDLLLFPAYELHAVAPVVEGERISLTGWLGGPRLV